jgi:hypothetical protein
MCATNCLTNSIPKKAKTASLQNRGTIEENLKLRRFRHPTIILQYSGCATQWLGHSDSHFPLYVKLPVWFNYQAYPLNAVGKRLPFLHVCNEFIFPL